MQRYFDFTSKILRVDLSNGKIEEDYVDSGTYELFLGGFGVGAKLLYSLLKPGVDPLSSDNPIIISSGALVGSNAIGTPKVSAWTKYPTIATEDGKHFAGASVGGGGFATAMKKAGYDHIIITGTAPKPVFLKIINEDVEIVDASRLWGRKDVVNTTNELRTIYGPGASVITIGRAGENLVRFSMAFIDNFDSLGRNGLGAVFGAKNLKAIVVRGTHDIPVANREYIREKNREIADRVAKWKKEKSGSLGQYWAKLGMAAGWEMFKYTEYPGKWTRSKWEKLYGIEKRMESVERLEGCPSCIIPCRQEGKIHGGVYDGEILQGSLYGKTATSGQLLGVEDYRLMLHMLDVANRAGIDFYTATRLIDFVTSSFERGELTTKGTTGTKLERNYECYINLLNQIIERRGFGDILAEGWIGVKNKTGLDPQKYWYAGITKGVDFIYDPRAATFHPLMMSFITNPRPHHGGCHTLTTGPGHSLQEIKNQVMHWGIPEETIKRIFTPTDYSGKFNVGIYAKYMEDAMCVRNSLGACSMYSAFGLIFMDDLAEYYSAATGRKISAFYLLKAGERIFNLKKLINAREGFTQRDKIPQLWLRAMESPEGKLEVKDYFKSVVIGKESFERILNDYYRERGWDIVTGMPTKEKLGQLNLNDFYNKMNKDR